MPLNRYDYCIAALSLVLTALLIHVKKDKSRAPYPPSRPRLPLFGNFFEIPKRTPWKTYNVWSRELDCDLISVWAFGQLSIIINSEKAVHDLFERRSAIYSDKPQTTMLSLMGWDFFIGFLPYAEKWRAQRRAFHQHFREPVVPEYDPMQQASAEKLVKRLYKLSGDVTASVQTNIAALFMDIVYGYDVAPENDPIVHALEEGADMLGRGIFPGAVAVDSLPALRHLPEWLPGMYFKTHARKCKVIVESMLQEPLAFVQRSRRDRKAIGGKIYAPGERGEQRRFRRHSSGAGSQWFCLCSGNTHCKSIPRGTACMFIKMLNQSAISLNVAIHAPLLHPDVQRRAQDELDVVVGRERLPNFADRQDLRYINAICREILRWKLAAPLGLPRMASQDDVYKGNFIPKGAVLLPNYWAMLHDPAKYPDPEAFQPERFLDKDGELTDDDVFTTFGFGRRICPGRHLVRSILFINIACILSVFNIRCKKDDRGNDIPVDVVYADGLTSSPSPWECEFVPRNEQAVTLLKRLEQDDNRKDPK